MSRPSLSRRLLLGSAVSAAAWGFTRASGEELAVASSPSTLRWLSGAGAPQPEHIAGGGFAAWRQHRTTFARIWADASLSEIRAIWMLDEYHSAGWNGTLDIACGGPRDGQTWRTAAAGGMDAIWRASCSSLRSKWGNLASVHLSMAHEMNGTWYPWSVTRETVADFKKAWTRWHGIVSEELIDKGKPVKVCLSMNADTLSDISVQAMTPEPEYFDVLGCDYYSMWPDLRDESTWDEYEYATGVGGSPRGVQAWFDYARSLGKPLSFPEWGVNPESKSENLFFTQKMRDVFALNASPDPARPAPGKLAGEAYFNHSDNARLWPDTERPQTAQQYGSLRWGS
jgi:hypothetical protein